jgi:hypothetical protein
MKNISLRLKHFAWFGCIAGVAGWGGVVRGATLSVSPTSVSNTYAGQITLQIGSVGTGERVVVNKYLDANTNGAVDAADWLVQSINLKDGGASVFGGVTNQNVPYDSNPTNGAITSYLGFQSAGVIQQTVGKYLFRLSSPTGGFTAKTNAFAVTQTAYSQGFSGRVQNNGTNIPYAGVLVLDPDGSPVASTVANGSGAYTSQVPPGVYQLAVFKTNLVYNIGAAPALNLTSGLSMVTNLNLILATRTISGKFVNATNSSIGIAGLLTGANSTNGLLVIGFTATNGTFSLPATPSGWEIFSDEEQLPAYGYLNLKDSLMADTGAGNVSGLTNALPQGTALFYGTVTDEHANPLPGLRFVSKDDADQYEGTGNTVSNGNYAIAVLPGSWNVWASSDNPGNYIFNGISTNITTGQAVRLDFTGSPGATISGTVLTDEGDTLDEANVEVGLVAFDEYGWIWEHVTGTEADSDGSYRLLVPPGTNYTVKAEGPYGSIWLRQYFSNTLDIAQATPVTVLTNAPATNINFNLQRGASISGTVLGGGNPLDWAYVEAGMVTFHGDDWWDWQWVASTDVDPDGAYTLTVPPGTNYIVQCYGPSGWLGQYYNQTSDVHAATPVATWTNAPATNINFNLQQGAQIRGRVQGGGVPLENVNVEAGIVTFWEGGGWLYQGFDSSNTDTNGDYMLTVPPGTNYTIKAYAPDGTAWLDQYYSNTLDISQATLVTALTNHPATNIDFNLQQGAIVSGRVRGAGNPLDGAGVQVGTIIFYPEGGWNWQQTYYGDTDANGDYTVTIPPGTNYFAQANASQGTTWLSQFYSNATDAASATVIKALTNAPATNINFNLILGMAIEGWITDASNNPVSTGIEVGRREGTNWTSIWWWGSGSDGYYSCTLAANSNYLVRINDPSYHEVFFSNKLSVASANAVSAPPGVTVSNVNFKLYDPLAQSDSDGFPDYIEAYVTGTDPFNSNDCLQCTGTLMGGGNFTLTWASVIGKKYGVERSANLLDGSAWTNLTPLPVTAIGTQTSFTDSNAPPRSSYRMGMPY